MVGGDHDCYHQPMAPGSSGTSGEEILYGDFRNETVTRSRHDQEARDLVLMRVTFLSGDEDYQNGVSPRELAYKYGRFGDTEEQEAEEASRLQGILLDLRSQGMLEARDRDLELNGDHARFRVTEQGRLEGMELITEDDRQSAARAKESAARIKAEMQDVVLGD